MIKEKNIMKVCISAESTIDLPKELLDKYDIHILPFTVLLGEESGLDGVITPDIIFNYVDRTGILPKTSAVNENQFEEHFSKLLKDYDAIVHISLSSEISSACSNAMLVAKHLKNVYIIDSKSLSTGIALLAIYASKLASQGKDAKEIYNLTMKRVNSVQASFVVNTMDYLYKGGRCSSLQKFGATLLRIKPSIILKDGKLIASKKYFGRNNKVIESYCEDIIELFDSPDLSLAFITHSHASPEMVEAAKKALEERGFKRICETIAGATISSHCGPKCLGILYLNDGENNH